jgi:hypothetical protein
MDPCEKVYVHQQTKLHTLRDKLTYQRCDYVIRQRIHIEELKAFESRATHRSSRYCQMPAE